MSRAAPGSILDHEYTLRRGDDTVRNGFTTARECCTLSPYSFEVTAPPGDYTLELFDLPEGFVEPQPLPVKCYSRVSSHMNS